MDLATWLRGLGLERHQAAFRDNLIDNIVREMSESDLEKLGLPLGERKRFLKGVAADKRMARGFRLQARPLSLI